MIMGKLGASAWHKGKRTSSSRYMDEFHSSIDADTQTRIVTEFPKAQSVIRLLVTTIAFGMGMDIPDIDVVVHWGCSETVISYLQEVGRAGRDGRQCRAIMFATRTSLSSKTTSDSMRELVRGNGCIRRAVLSAFKLPGMEAPDGLPDKHQCCSNCSTQGE